MKEAFIQHDKLSLLVADLLVSEAWMQHALLLLRSHLALHGNTLVSYALVHHQRVVANLLEVMLHHSDAATCLSEGDAIELCDWCARQVAFLDYKGRKFAQGKPKSAKEILAQPAEEDLKEQEQEIYFGCELAALTILRHLSDHAASNALSLGVLHRIAMTNNIAAGIVLLLLHPPWDRPFPGKGGGKQRWEKGEWVRVMPAELQRLSTAEAQAWLLLCNLLLDPAAFAKLDIDNEFFVDSLLQLRPKLTPSLTQQLPLSESLLRFLEALAMGAANQWHRSELHKSGKTESCVIIQVPKLRAALLEGTDWAVVAKRQREHHLAPSNAASNVNKELFSQIMDNIDFLCDMYEGEREEKDDICRGQITAPIVKLDTYCEVGTEKWSWHASYRFKLELDTPPEVIKVEVPQNEDINDGLREILAPEKEFLNEVSLGVGNRYRLELVKEPEMKALASEMKFVVGFEDKVCEAMVSFPAPSTR